MHQLIEQVEKIKNRADVPVAHRMDVMLELGATALNMDMAFVGRVMEDSYFINRHFSDKYTNGQEYPLKDTYASLTIGQSGIMYIEHMKESAHRFHLAYRLHRWEAYIGVPLIVLNRVFGTLEFANEAPRPFGESHINSVYVMGASLAELIEQDVRAQASERAARANSV